MQAEAWLGYTSGGHCYFLMIARLLFSVRGGCFPQNMFIDGLPRAAIDALRVEIYLILEVLPNA